MVANFRWVVPQKLAVSGLPLTLSDARSIIEQGVRYVISLERPGREALESMDGVGVETLYLPVADFGVPSTAQMERARQFIDRAAGPVLVHCLGGRGRSPAVAAAYLVAHGWTAEAALEAVQGVETPEQVAFVRTAGSAHSE